MMRTGPMELTIKELMMKRLETEPLCLVQLEMGSYDYNLSQIARIVEDDDAKILALSVESIEDDPGRIMVNLLINKSECDALLQSFYRFNYNVVNTFSSPDENSDLMDRYSHLMRYLDV